MLDERERDFLYYIIGDGDAIAQSDLELIEPIAYSVDWKDCHNKWELVGHYDSIFHIFGHSDGESFFLLDETEPDFSELRHKLNASRFATFFRKDALSTSATICLLNGCRTGGATSTNSFLAATSAAGFEGFIGSEAQVSNEFAARYGVEFMRELLVNGSSIQEAFEFLRARRDLFPLNRMYSCYANPNYRVEKLAPMGVTHAAHSSRPEA